RGGDPAEGGDSTDAHGFIGALAWIPNEDKFVAVGGTGCYPRREVDCAPANQPSGSADKIAGDGLAWAFENGTWHRIPTPSGMTGMTAIAFSQRFTDCGDAHSDCGFAGGRGQL